MERPTLAVAILGLSIGAARAGTAPPAAPAAGATPAAPAAGTPAPSPAADDKAIFARLRGMAGDWEGHMMTPVGLPTSNIYKLTSHGNTVMETILVGNNREMVSMYYLDGGELAMDHFCAMGNQPHFRVDRKVSTPDELHLVADEGKNLDPKTTQYMRNLRITWKSDDEIEELWEIFSFGQKTDVLRFFLKRKPAPVPSLLPAPVQP